MCCSRVFSALKQKSPEVGLTISYLIKNQLIMILNEITRVHYVLELYSQFYMYANIFMLQLFSKS